MYERLLQKAAFEYDFILWNRSGNGVEISPGAKNNHILSLRTNTGKITKVLQLLKWRAFVKEVLKTEIYELLIICTTMPAVLLGRLLVAGYAGRYVLDVRDYTHENLSLYKHCEKEIIQKAGLVTISSRGFVDWLPARTGDTVITHNIDNVKASGLVSLANDKPVRIGFVGGVRYFDINKKMIASFANNPEYILKYVGKEHPGCDLGQFCAVNNIKNVFFEPRYANDEKPEIYRGIDIINCVYGSSTLEVQTALPNKLYDCIIFKKPIMVSRGTYLAQLVERRGLGFAVDVDKDDILKVTQNYISNFDCESFISGCDELFAEVVSEQQIAEDRIFSYIKQIATEGKS
jgi:hypothetical protein